MAYTYNDRNLLTGITTAGGPIYSFNASTSGNIDGLGRLKRATETIGYPGRGNSFNASIPLALYLTIHC